MILYYTSFLMFLQCILLIVDMMCCMKIFVQWLYVMQLSVHPVNSKLHKDHIYSHISNVGWPTNFSYTRETSGPSFFNHVFWKCWKSAIPRHSLHCDYYLQKHGFVWRYSICTKTKVSIRLEIVVMHYGIQKVITLLCLKLY